MTAGGRAVLTDPELPSGSDRILAALAEVDPTNTYDAVINLQGDMPFVEPGVEIDVWYEAPGKDGAVA